MFLVLVTNTQRLNCPQSSPVKTVGCDFQKESINMPGVGCVSWGSEHPQQASGGSRQRRCEAGQREDNSANDFFIRRPNCGKEGVGCAAQAMEKLQNTRERVSAQGLSKTG